MILLLRVALATIHSEINPAFRKYVYDKTEGFIELFTFMSVIIYNKSARFLVSMSTKSSFSLTFDFLRKMFPELNFQRRPEKISQSQRTVLLPLTWKLSFKTLSWKMSRLLYLISHKTFLTKKALLIAKTVLCRDKQCARFHINQFKEADHYL